MSHVGFVHKLVSQTRSRCTSITTGMIMEQYNVQIFLFAMTVLKVRKNCKRRNSYLPGSPSGNAMPMFVHSEDEARC